MNVNPDKFQFMILSSKPCNNDVSRTVCSNDISASDHICVLGIDNRLNFGTHVNKILKCCPKQTNEISRLMYVLGKTKI